MNYQNMTKEQLIDYIEEMKIKRAFTYEDQMKLVILDNSPFTIWASDRNCIIKLWMGQCETLYGYSSKEAIGKDYVELFVANDERLAARRDQIDIIDNEATFHNIANDVGKNGNVLQLVTNCRRIKDPITGEFWNAEMGLIIDYLEQEREHLKQIIAESQRIKLCVVQFIEDTGQVKEQFFNRQNLINGAIRECEKKATALRKRGEFKRKIFDVRTNLTSLSQRMTDIYEMYISKIQSCAFVDKCQEIRNSFFKEYEIISDELEEMALDVFDISCEYDVEQNLVSDKDTLMKNMASSFRKLLELAHNITREVDQEIVDYKEKVSVTPNLESGPFKTFLDLRQEIICLKDEMERYEDELSVAIMKCSSKLNLETIKTQAESRCNMLNKQIEEIEHKLKEC